MADSRRLRILKALKARVEAISTANGYRTDAGQRIYFAEKPSLGAHDPDAAILMVPKEDQIGEALSNLPILLPVDFIALVKPTADEPWQVVEDVIADIKQAIELEDRSLGGLLTGGRNNPQGLLRGTTEVFTRESGSDTAGALITYVAKYAEAWGTPEA